MSLAFCVCPAPSAILDIPAFTCEENFGQIQKIIFQRRQATADQMTASDAALKATWDALLAETDATKVQITPFFENFVVPPVEAIKEGGDDNTTLDGVARVVGEGSPAATGNFVGLPTALFEAIQKYNCERDLTAYWVNEFGKILGISSSGTNFAGIPMTEFYIGDKGINGKNTVDKSMFTFALRPGWSKKIKIITPSDFDARVDLIN